MTQTSQTIAVISGDIINSTKLSSAQYEQLLAQIKSVQSLISKASNNNQHSITRGDEFQTVVHDIANVLRYTLLYKVGIKSLGKAFDSRISFAIACNADLRASVSESMGDAFVLSGRGLKTMKSDRLVFSADKTELSNHFDLLIKYLDRQLSELTARQCQVMLPMLWGSEDLSVSELAQKLDIATATASKSLKASGWSLISELNQRFTKQVAGLSHD